jgi:hypothetical protein
MIVEMGDYAWSEHIVTVFLAYPDGRGNGRSVQLVNFVVI